MSTMRAERTRRDSLPCTCAAPFQGDRYAGCQSHPLSPSGPSAVLGCTSCRGMVFVDLRADCSPLLWHEQAILRHRARCHRLFAIRCPECSAFGFSRSCQPEEGRLEDGEVLVSCPSCRAMLVHVWDPS